VRYGGACSLDGFIAGPDGEIDWIVTDPEINFAELFKQFDTLLIGRRTFMQMVAAGQARPAKGMATYVFSRTLRPKDHPGVTIVGTDLGPTMENLRRGPGGKDIWLFGGGQLFRSLLEQGYVDVVEVGLVPVCLAGGSRSCRAWVRRWSFG